MLWNQTNWMQYRTCKGFIHGKHLCFIIIYACVICSIKFFLYILQYCIGGIGQPDQCGDFVGLPEDSSSKEITEAAVLIFYR